MPWRRHDEPAADERSGIPAEIFDALPSPAWVVQTGRGLITASNAAAVRMFGDDPPLAVSSGGTRRRRLGTPGPGPVIDPARRRTGRPAKPAPRQHRHVTVDDQVVWIELQRSPLGRGAELVVARDVTDLRSGRDRLRIVEAAVEAARDVVLLTEAGVAGPAGPTVVYANRAFERILGWSADEVVGQTLPPILDPDADREALEAIRRALVRRESVGVEVLARRRDGSELWLDVSIEHATDGPAGGHHCVWVMRDVTDRRRLQDELLEAARMDAVGRIAGGLAHDFNNLLAIVAGATQMARWRLPDDAALQGHLREIEGATTRAHRLTNQLLTASRRGGMRPKTIDAAAAVRDLLPLVRRLVGSNVEVQAVLPAPGPQVRVDPTHFEQAIFNLVANARDAMPDGGPLAIRIEFDADEVRLVVSDGGHGMDAETLAQATDVFFTTKPRGSGTGLGLSSVRAVAERHGGHVDVVSALGSGTQVTVALPRIAVEGVDVSSPLSSETVQDRPVLLLEDEPALRGLLAAGMRRAGFTVREDDGSGTAPDLVAGGPYRLVVSDLNLGAQSAGDLLQALRAAQPGVPILCISGYDAADADLGDIPAGVEMLRKPFNLTQLGEAIERTVRGVAAAAAA